MRGLGSGAYRQPARMLLAHERKGSCLGLDFREAGQDRLIEQVPERPLSRVALPLGVLRARSPADFLLIHAGSEANRPTLAKQQSPSQPCRAPSKGPVQRLACRGSFDATRT